MIITSQKLVTDTQTLERKENMHITNTRGKAERNKEQKSTTKTTKTQITK